MELQDGNLQRLELVLIHSSLELRELIKEHNVSFPREQDLRGCAQAILRIQDVYHISAEKIANGKLSDNIVSPELRTIHCLGLGHVNDDWGRYEEAYGWFTEAWKRLSPLDRSNGMKTKDVLQYLIWTEYKVRGLGRDRLFCCSLRLETWNRDHTQFSLRELGLPQGTRTKCN